MAPRKRRPKTKRDQTTQVDANDLTPHLQPALQNLKRLLTANLGCAVVVVVVVVVVVAVVAAAAAVAAVVVVG